MTDDADAGPPSAYTEAMAFWYGRINYEQRAPKPGDLKLDRMRALLHLLGDPQGLLRVVHVAGSKGKGSTSAMLAAVLRRAGHRTGLFTSPHLVRVEERMQLDGALLSGPELVALMRDVRAAVERLDALGGQRPGQAVTFFEVATALGLLHFRRRRADAAVVEVGLGGRFDSTNVVLPEVALITSISLDHVQQLGSRIASIAREKAGIVKPGRPVVSGATEPDAREVIEATCRRCRAPLRQLGVDFHYEYDPGELFVRRPRVRVRTRTRAWPALELNLLGEHQAANAAVAVACVEELRRRGWHLPDAAVAAGLAEVQWPARLEVLGRRPLVVLDCAHNVASAHAVVETLTASLHAENAPRKLLIFAASSDKDVAGMLQVLAPAFTHLYLTQFSTNQRALTPEQLAALLPAPCPTPHTLCPNPAAAWELARSQAGPDDLVLATGSVFLAGELRPLLAAAQASGGRQPPVATP